MSKDSVTIKGREWDLYPMEEVEEMKVIIQRVTDLESEIRHGWRFQDDPRSPAEKFRHKFTNQLRAALRNES